MKIRNLGFVVSALALLSSCETIVPQEMTVEVLPAEEQVIFTADLGADTKTYLEYQDGVYKTRWAEGDDIFLLAINSSENSYWRETADIIEGAGTSEAKFAASANAKGDKYFAYYGFSANFTAAGEFYPNLQEYQYRGGNNIDGPYYPMYAESTTRSLSFKNLCSILKVDLLGTDYIDNIVFTPNDPTIPVAGRTKLVYNNGNPELVFENDSTTRYQVCLYVQETLDPTVPVTCFISLPAQTYKGGFTLTINSSTGSMQVKTTEDVTLERSQLRSVPAITYKNQTTNSWGICGEMTNWTEDIAMVPHEQYYVVEGLNLEAGRSFKFRANGSWDVNFGYVNGAIEPDSIVELTSNGPNMYVTQSGTYDIILDPVKALAQFVRTDTELPEYVECSSYEEVAALPDNTTVLVKGTVFAPYQRGFVMNIGDYWNNCILVYQGTQHDYYMPVMGNQVAMIAQKVTYNGLPEITNIQYFQILDSKEYDYGYNRYYDLYDPEVFRNSKIERYEYVKFAGKFEKSGNYYNVIVDGVEDRIGSIEFPLQDLTEYLGQKVSVEGWFIGYTGQYMKIVLKSISTIDGSGTAEDVVPGDDVVVTTRSTSKIME